ncbi:MAG: glutathione S-transferase family protein, partial [Bdellovibrionota bacterium]
RSKKKAQPYLDVLDRAIGNKTYIVGEQFSVADINAASVANIALALGLPLGDKPNLMRWLTALKARPSFAKFGEK